MAQDQDLEVLGAVGTFEVEPSAQDPHEEKEEEGHSRRLDEPLLRARDKVLAPHRSGPSCTEGAVG